MESLAFVRNAKTEIFCWWRASVIKSAVKSNPEFTTFLISIAMQCCL